MPPTEYSPGTKPTCRQRLSTITPPGETAWELSYQQLTGDVDGGRLASVKRTTPQGVAETKLVYGVPVGGLTAPWQMGAADVDKWAQKDVPAEATAIFPVDHPPASSSPTLAEYEYATVHYMNVSGREVNVVVPGGHTTTSEYDRFGNVIRELAPSNRQRAMNAGGLSKGEAEVLDTERVFSDDGLEMVDELGPRHSVRLTAGTVVQARRHTTVAYDEGAPLVPSPGGPLPGPHLPTTTTVGAKVIGGSDMVDARVSKTEYDWLLRKPTAQITDAAAGGLQLKTVMVYDSATGLPTEKRMPRNPAGGDASETKTIAYKADAPAGWDGDCVNRPEWASMPCKVKPAAQPGTQGLPELPVTTYTYNRLGQPATETEKVGSTTRVSTHSYQDVGRPFANTVAVASPARAGLVAAYSFDEGAGTTITDLSGHNNSGSFSGAAWNTGGKFGGALSFDGVNDAASIADTASLNLSKGMTLEAWVKPSASMGKRTIIAKQHPTGLSYGLYSNTTSSGPAAEGPATASSNTSLGTGTWKHVAATYDGTTLKLYVNGGLVASQATTANMSANAGPLGIGGHDFGGDYFQGLIDEVRIYDRALSGPEVLFDQNTAVSATADVAGTSGNAPEDERLAAGYDFEEGTGSKAVFDMSGNGNDAQPSGSASPS